MTELEKITVETWALMVNAYDHSKTQWGRLEEVVFYSLVSLLLGSVIYYVASN